MSDLKRLLDRVPDATHFPTVAEVEHRLSELYSRAPHRCSLDVLGHSRGGQPLTRITIGSGDHHAVVVGMPHPNEPIGTPAALALAELLLEDDALLAALGLVWHIVPCVDPDGAALNYGWYGGPYTRANYARHVYRPPFAEQFEWTFSRPDLGMKGLPFIPESTAIAALIDEVKPRMLASLHNGEGGELFTFVENDLAGLPNAVHRVCEAVGLGVYVGEPEDDEPVLGPGVFLAVDAGDVLSSTGYAQPYGTLGLVVEPPMWRDPRAADDSLSAHTHRKVDEQCRSLRKALRSCLEEWLLVLDAAADLDTPRGRAIRAQLENLARPHGRDHGDHAESPCTVAYEASSLEAVVLERLRGAGHVLAFVCDEEAAGRLSDDLARVRDEAAHALDAWATASPELEFVGLGAGVRAHVGVVIETARLLASTRKAES